MLGTAKAFRDQCVSRSQTNPVLHKTHWCVGPIAKEETALHEFHGLVGSYRKKNRASKIKIPKDKARPNSLHRLLRFRAVPIIAYSKN